MEVEDVEGSKQWGSRFKGDLCDCLLELEGLGGPLLFFLIFIGFWLFVSGLGRSGGVRLRWVDGDG